MKGIQLRNKADKAAEILIYEDIGEGFWTSGITAQGFLKDLKALGEIDSLDIRINSNGGSVFDGVAIYNALKRHPATKNVYVDGIAASIASVIAMAGDSITMGEGSFMMIHKASGLAVGNANEMRDLADILEGIDAQLIDIYSNRTGMDSELINKMMDEETWMNASEAIEKKFADSVGEKLKIAARADAKRFHNLPWDLKRQNMSYDAHKDCTFDNCRVTPDQTAAWQKDADPNIKDSHSGPSEVPNKPADEPAPVLNKRKETTMNIMDQLKARASEHQTAAAAIREKANTESRDLTNAEREIIQSHLDAFDAVQTDIELQARLEGADDFLNQSAGRKAQPDGLKNTRLTPASEKGKGGFNHFGEFCAAVRESTNTGKTDPRLIANAATTYGSEGTGADGGHAVPPEWNANIVKMIMGEDSLISRTDQLTIGSNSTTYPVDETTAWQSSGGIRVYRDSEAAAITQSKPSLKDLTIKLQRMTCLVPLTDELLEDSVAMGSYVQAKAGENFDFKITDEILNGTGVGQMLGILNAPCTVSVAKETSQVAGTLVAENVLKLWSRMEGRARRNAVWLVNQDIEPQLMQLNVKIKNVAGSENVGGMPVYVPPGGLSASPYATLLGRPVITTEACQTVGTKGDIVFAALDKYMTVAKAGGIRSDVSIHLFFDQGITAFRFVMRNNGQPWLSAPITRKNGTNTLSHFVTLDTRS